MKVTYKVLMAVLLAGFFLGGCAEKDTAVPAEDAMEQAAPATEEMATEEAAVEEEAPAADEPGGYVPTDEERVPGETRP